MRQLLTAVICISIFLPTPEALALFGRRGPVARLLFGPGPQIIGGGRLLGRSGCGRGGCRPRNRCGNGNRSNNQQFFVDEFGNTTDEFGNPVQFDQFGNAFDIFGNQIDQFGSVSNSGCGSQFGNFNNGNFFNNGGFQDVLSQFDANGIFNPSLGGQQFFNNGQFGNGQFNGNQFGGSQFSNGQFNNVGNGGLVDPTGAGVVNTGATSNPFGSVIGQNGSPVDPFSNLGPVRQLTLNGVFRENGNQVSIGPVPNCRLFQSDRFGRRLPIDPRNEIRIFQYYQSKEASGRPLSQLQRCVLQFYRQNFGNTPFFKPVASTGGGATGGTTSGSHGGTSPTPGQRPTDPNPQSVFAKWKADFNSGSAVKATDGHILASTANSPSENKKFNYTIIEQDCVSKADPDTKIPTTLILFNSKDKDGKDQSHMKFIPGGIKDEDKKKEVEAAWKSVTADPNEAGGGKLRNVEGDPSSFYTTFSVQGLLEYPETQVQLKKIMKNGQEQFISRYVHKHGTSLPDGRWKINEKDAPYYCENHTQPQQEKVNCDRVSQLEPGTFGTLGGSGRINGYYLNRQTNKCEATQDLGSATSKGPFGTLEECEKTVAAGLCKEPESSSSVTKTPSGTAPGQERIGTVFELAKNIMISKCLKCHTSPKADSPTAPVFNADGSLKSGKISDILASVENGSMPMGGTKLTPSEIQAIKQWNSGKDE